jgi:hypothetical protein
LPLLTLLAFAVVIFAERIELSTRRRQQLFLLAAVTTYASLIQYPYSGGYYFFYAAPCGVLLATYLFAFQPVRSRLLPTAAFVLTVGFVVLRMHFPGPSITGGPYAPRTATASVGLERCNLIVTKEQADLYRGVVRFIQQHSTPGEAIYAAPDSPEIYFLSGRKNPTRSFYELFREKSGMDDQGLLDCLNRWQVRVVILKHFSEFSSGVSPQLRREIETRFPEQAKFVSGEGSDQHGFTVYWRREVP